VSVPADEIDAGLDERLAAATLDLVNIPSVSGDEVAILDAIGAALPEGFDVVDREDAVLFAVPSTRRDRAPFVVLAGHVDTVPHHGNFPGTRDDGTVVGRGVADMKGALAVMLETATWLAAHPGASDLDVGLLFFGREELPITQSALLPLLERCALTRSIDLAVVMEPTANAIHLGCLGNLNATIVFHGRAAHTARPWFGHNAIHTAIGALAPIADLSPRDVEIDGLVFREVLSVTAIEGGIAGNVVPDRVEARVNFRYAPTRTPAEAEARLRELISFGETELTVVGNAPPGPLPSGNPLVERLRAAGGLDVAPKQAWTSVAEFGMVGVDAVNFGPGDPQYAHRDDERVTIEALVRSCQVLRGFLAEERAS
jgi:succinyl-diaminopimelate desuccinylase